MPWRKQEKEGGLGHAAPALYPVSKASNSGGWEAGDPGSWRYHEAKVWGEGKVARNSMHAFITLVTGVTD